MMYFIFFIGLILLHFGLGLQSALRNQIYFVVLGGLFVFSAFRYQVGCDWGGYFNQYLDATAFSWSSATEIREPIWRAFLFWVREMGLPYPVVNVASSAIFFLGVHILARRQLDRLGFLVLLFPVLIINLPMSGIRQGVAVGLLCIAFVAFVDRRVLWFGLWVLLAAGIHSSALVFMLLLPLASGRYNRGRLMLAAILAVPGAFFLVSGDAGQLAIDRYVDTEVDAFGAVFRVGILALTSSYFFLFLRKKWQHISPQDFSLVSVGAIGMALTFLFVPISSVIADRLAYYLVPIQAVIFARIPFFRFRAGARLHAAIPYLSLLLVFMVWSQFSGHFKNCYIPYQSWFFGFPGVDFLF